MCGRGHKRPQQESEQSRLHADDGAAPVAIKRMPSGPPDEHAGGKPGEDDPIDRESEHQERGQDGRNGGGVTEGDRSEGEQNDPSALAVQPEGNREKPAHGWIDAVIDAEAGDNNPRPKLRIGVAHRTVCSSSGYAGGRSDLISYPPLHLTDNSTNRTSSR